MGLRAARARPSRRRSSRTAPPLPPTADTPGRAHDGSTRSTTLGDGSGSGRRVSRGALRGANGCFAPTTTPMGRAASGHVEQLPSGSFRVEVHAGTDPLTGRRLRFRQTVKTGKQAQIVLAACSSRPLPDSSRTRPHGCRAAGPVHGSRRARRLRKGDLRGMNPPHDPARAGSHGTAQAARAR